MSKPRNYWPDSKCAKAFWGQHELPAYGELLADTEAWLDPRPGERWIDLGCGGGRLTRSLWNKSEGQVAEILGIDCAEVNARAYEQISRDYQPGPQQQIAFQVGDLSAGFPHLPSASFDGVVSGLAIQYAESYSEAQGRWTQDAYDHVLREVRRILKPGGRFVFSVNVPEPNWLRVGLSGPLGFFRAAHPLEYAKRFVGMWRYGGWLTRESRTGRFHYLPVDAILVKLKQAGFASVQHRTTYVGQAFLFRCETEASPQIHSAA